MSVRGRLGTCTFGRIRALPLILCSLLPVAKLDPEAEEEDHQVVEVELVRRPHNSVKE